MGNIYIALGGSGGTSSDDVTATKDKVLAGYTAVTNDSNDEPITGTMANRGAWRSSVGMNSQISIPSGYHNGDGYINGPTITQRGAPTYNLPINGTQNLPEGYYSGGRVTQSIPTFGGQTVNPSASQQVVSCTGKYATGNVTINPVVLPAASDIRQGVNFYGRVGTLQDYSYLIKDQVSF